MDENEYEDTDWDETPPDTDEDCGCEGDEELFEGRVSGSVGELHPVQIQAAVLTRNPEKYIFIDILYFIWGAC